MKQYVERAYITSQETRFYPHKQEGDLIIPGKNKRFKKLWRKLTKQAKR